MIITLDRKACARVRPPLVRFTKISFDLMRRYSGYVANDRNTNLMSIFTDNLLILFRSAIAPSIPSPLFELHASVDFVPHEYAFH